LVEADDILPAVLFELVGVEARERDLEEDLEGDVHEDVGFEEEFEQFLHFEAPGVILEELGVLVDHVEARNDVPQGRQTGAQNCQQQRHNDREGVEVHVQQLLDALVEIVHHYGFFELEVFFLLGLDGGVALDLDAVLLEHLLEALSSLDAVLPGEELAVEVEEVRLDHPHREVVQPDPIQLHVREPNPQVKAPVPTVHQEINLFIPWDDVGGGGVDVVGVGGDEGVWEGHGVVEGVEVGEGEGILRDHDESNHIGHSDQGAHFVPLAGVEEDS